MHPSRRTSVYLREVRLREVGCTAAMPKVLIPLAHFSKRACRLLPERQLGMPSTPPPASWHCIGHPPANLLQCESLADKRGEHTVSMDLWFGHAYHVIEVVRHWTVAVHLRSSRELLLNEHKQAHDLFLHDIIIHIVVIGTCLTSVSRQQEDDTGKSTIVHVEREGHNHNRRMNLGFLRAELSTSSMFVNTVGPLGEILISCCHTCFQL